jgi:hypothetical protein
MKLASPLLHVSVFRFFTFFFQHSNYVNFLCVYLSCVIALSCGLRVGLISPHRYKFDSEALQTDYPHLFHHVSLLHETRCVSVCRCLSIK